MALTVSRGRQPIDVPDLTGKDATGAARQLSGLGLKVDATQQQNSDTVAKGAVISQSPRDGTAFRGDTVTLVVSKGPVLVDRAQRGRPAAAAGPRRAAGRRGSRSRSSRRSAASSARCASRTPPVAARRPRAAPSPLTIV